MRAFTVNQIGVCARFRAAILMLQDGSHIFTTLALRKSDKAHFALDENARSSKRFAQSYFRFSLRDKRDITYPLPV